MVDGVKMVFRKSRMLERVRSEGSIDSVGDEECKLLDILDGQEASSVSWIRQINGVSVYSCKGKGEKTYYVYEGDCE